MNTAVIHPNLKLLSHSSSVLLHKCPRKYELYKLKEAVDEQADYHLSFGSAVGVGIQAMLCGFTFDEAVWRMFLSWNMELNDESGMRDKKTFYYAISALERFIPHCASLLSKYEVVVIGDKVGVELGFKIALLDGFSYRGYVDVVLRNRESGELIVLELKTTKFSKIHEAVYKHSGQALGYSLVLDAVAKSVGTSASYRVVYYIYKSGAQEWEVMPFDKSYLQRALWIKQLLMDQHAVEYFVQEQIFPMHGENCYDFFRPCKYFGICELSNSHLLPKEITVQADKMYDFNFDIKTLIESQLEAHPQENSQ